jgi:hypothetical protein
MAMGAAEALVQDVFGLPLLAYLCAADEPVVEARLEGTGALGPKAEAVLVRQLVPLAQHAATMAAGRGGHFIQMDLEVLGHHHEPSGTSIGNALRLEAGGDLPEHGLRTDDEVGRVLLDMLVDQYPVMLLPPDPWRPPSLALFRHPKGDELLRLVATDPELSRLFPEEDEGMEPGRIGMLYSSLGGGWTFQSVMFANAMLRSAWDAASTLVRQPSIREVADQTLSHLDLVRRAASGEAAEIRALVCFTGFTMKDGGGIATPWGPLRPLTELEKRLAPPALEGAVSTTHPDGTALTVSYAGEVVLDTTLPYALAATPHSPGDLPPAPKFPGLGELQHRVEGIQLAALLGVDRPAGSELVARLAWTFVAEPLSHGPRRQWSDARAGPAFVPYELNRDECESLGHWCELVHMHRRPAIEVAIRRVISAALVRLEPADRLVDAVIAWENLFGTAEGEPRLRISAALAWLVGEESASAREELQARLRSLYDTRSKIVHGGVVDQDSLATDANEAFGYAVRALAVLFKERPDVLTLPDGAARSLRLVLGG